MIRKKGSYAHVNARTYAYAGAVAGAAVSLLSFLAGISKAVNIQGVHLYSIALSASAIAAVVSIYYLRIKGWLPEKQRIFVIYSHKDIDFAINFVENLKSAGFDPWFDRDEILPGQKIESAIAEGIAQSTVAVLLVSKNLNSESKYINDEIELALSMMRTKGEAYSPIIPVVLDDATVPPPLDGVHGIRLLSDADFEKLKEGLRSALATQ